MKNTKVVTLLLLVIFIISISFNIFYSNKLKTLENTYNNKQEALLGEVNYHKKNFTTLLSIDSLSLNVLSNKNIIIYYSASTCSICVEKSLHLINENYDDNLKRRLLILTNHTDNKVLIERFNDMFQLDYEIALDSKIQNFSDVLILKLQENDIQSVLTYNPSSEYYFIKYISFFL